MERRKLSDFICQASSQDEGGCLCGHNGVDLGMLCAGPLGKTYPCLEVCSSELTTEFDRGEDCFFL